MALFLVATPIGNLSDFTLRAVEILQSCEYILCEDTRHSRILMQHYQIDKPLRSFHKFNEAAREEEVIQDLKSGRQVALVSDAGTPGIADPGERIVQRCVDEGIEVTPIPGPCAIITALCASGLPTQPFQFVGFLPKRPSLLNKAVEGLLAYSGTSICYESPLRLRILLQKIVEKDAGRHIVVARELTKKFEEIRRGTADELLIVWPQAPKGEIVVLIAPPSPGASVAAWEHMTPAEHVTWYQETRQVTSSEAIKAVADLRGVPKKIIYKAVHIHSD